MNEFIEILSSPGHWAFEVVSDLAFTALAYPVAKRRVRAHDKKVHGKGVHSSRRRVR